MVVVMVGTLWIAGIRAPWSPEFEAEALSPAVAGGASVQVRRGAEIFHAEGCQFCHAIAGQGGRRGPNLTDVAERLPVEQITISILDGREGMPAYAGTLTPEEVRALVAFLQAQADQTSGTDPGVAGAGMP